MRPRPKRPGAPDVYWPSAHPLIRRGWRSDCGPPYSGCETLRNCIHLLLSLRQRHSRLEARDNRKPERAALEAQLGRDRQRFPEVDVAVRIAKGRWHNATYGKSPAVKRDRLADNPRVSAEPPYPQTMAEDRLAGAPQIVVIRRERITDEGPYTEYIKKVRRYCGALSCSGSPEPVSARLVAVYAANPAMVLLWARQSRNRG
jgi:hypothetical protein